MAATQAFSSLISVVSCHQINVDYPAMRLLDNASDDFELHPVNNVHTRYGPHPLTPNGAVTAHAFRDSLEETKFFSYNNATRAAENETLWLLEAPSDRLQLTSEMEIVKDFIAITTLSVLTYKPKPGNVLPDTSRIKIHRFTCVSDKSHFDDQDEYDMTLEDFENIRADGELWLQNIKDLIYRRSDRAVLHVSTVLKSLNMNYDEPPWKLQRHPPYGPVMAKKMKVVRMNDEEVDCAICWDPMLSNEDAIEVLCSARHMFHKDCLVKVCEAATPDMARCPLCRESLFSDVRTLDYLNFGIVEGTYVIDKRYHEWENFERSCSAFDREKAENDPEIILCVDTSLGKILKRIVDGAASEPESSTPHHLQPARSAEVKVVLQTFEAALRPLRGQNVKVKTLFEQMRLAVNQALLRTYACSDTKRPLIKPESYSALLMDPATAQRFTMPPGFLEFVERSLSRTLKAYRLGIRA